MNCPKCHKPSIPDAVFCAYCGRKLAPSTRKPKRSPNGTGSAYQRPGQKTWTASVVVGYRDPPPYDPESPANKKQRVPIKKTHGGFSTKAEALAYCPILKAGGKLKPELAPTLQYYWDNYEKNELEKLSDSKQTAYRIAWDKLKDLHELHVDQIMVQDLRDAVKKRCSTYYPAKDCRTVLSNLYRIAAADGFANKDLPSFIELPTLTEQIREPFNDTEQTALWKLYESGDLRAAIPLLMIYTGMMPGEAFDLKVDMIDLENRQIIGAGLKTKVRKQTPITLASFIIPVVQDLIAHARPSGRLFGTSEDKWREDYYGALEAAKCRRLQPYSCRHTTATALTINKQIAPQTVQKVMRWSSTKMLDRYAHPDTKDAQAAVDSLVGSEMTVVASEG